MECLLCKETKLPNEYPPENVADECRHPPLVCLRCTIKNVAELSVCPYPGCKREAKLSDGKLQLFQAIVNDLFKVYGVDESVASERSRRSDHPVLERGLLTVTLLTGESLSVEFDPNLEVLELKRIIQEKMKRPVDRQKLLYNDTELKDYTDGKRSRISHFGCQPNSTICLVILLFAIPEEFDHVVFDLRWGYPEHGKDYLDASCLMFTGTTFKKLADYYYQTPYRSVQHSGDMLNRRRKRGHHTINVKLQELPTYLTHLFFTLSAWDSPNISKYPNPSLRFYEADNPSVNLCETTFTHARHSQAVIMCSVSRDVDGRWKIFESGKLSAGNVEDYTPLKKTIRQLISQGF